MKREEEGWKCGKGQRVVWRSREGSGKYERKRSCITEEKVEENHIV